MNCLNQNSMIQTNGDLRERPEITSAFSKLEPQIQKPVSMLTGFRVSMPDSITWPVAPRGMPVGYQQAMLLGNPKEEAQFTFRAKIPPNWKAMPHFHPADEYITVLEGSCYVGVGEKYDEEIAIELPLNAFILIRSGTIHYFYTKQKCIIQVHGIGPQKITYINPDDDPRKLRDH
jgi:quercetin dioxygenase-like cupin family protein